MKTIRELWDIQADEYNQFDNLDSDEIEEFANKIIFELQGKIKKQNEK